MLHSYWRTKDVSKGYDVLARATSVRRGPPRDRAVSLVLGCLVYLPFWRFQAYGRFRFEDTSVNDISGNLRTGPRSNSVLNPAILLKLIQIGVGRRIAQDTTHRDDLAFVMESVSQDVMEDECGRPDREVSIGEMQLRGGNEVLLAKA